MAERRRGGAGYYWTVYHQPSGHRYTAHIWAPSLPKARAICVQRGIGEELYSEWTVTRYNADLPSELAMRRRPDWAEVAHAATFLGWVGLKSGVLTVDEVLADQGLVHELLHRHCLGAIDWATRRQNLVKRLRAWEARVPGFTDSSFR